MARASFFCIDAHTAGNPVRVVAGGAPRLEGATMREKRRHFLAEYDWIRTGLMFEPRGHAMMSGSILYEPTRADCDAGLLFIETSGCLPMCGHGAIGAATVVIEEGLVRPRTPGVLRLDVPAGVVEAHYAEDDRGKVTSVRIVNVPSFLYARGLSVEAPSLGRLGVEVSYGGNFYAIIEPQEGYGDLSALSKHDIQRLSPIIRARLNAAHRFVHPEDATISGLSHVMWTGRPQRADADARNAVFYGDNAIDRSPCGTGTSARMAQLVARGALAPGDVFRHESIIGSLFTGRVEGRARIGAYDAIIPSVEGSAWITGHNTLFIDDRDPFAAGFVVP